MLIKLRIGLQLGCRALALGLLENGVELCGLHHVTLDLELAGHEELLGIGLAVDELLELGVGE